MDLAQLLSEVPGILKLLDSRSLKALHRVSRNPHQQVHDFVSSIFIDNKEQVGVLNSDDWPALTQLSFQTLLHPKDLLCLSVNTWQHVVILDFAKVRLPRSSLYMLANDCWPLVQHVNLSGTNLSGYRMAALPLRSELHILYSCYQSCLQSNLKLQASHRKVQYSAEVGSVGMLELHILHLG